MKKADVAVIETKLVAKRSDRAFSDVLHPKDDKRIVETVNLLATAVRIGASHSTFENLDFASAERALVNRKRFADWILAHFGDMWNDIASTFDGD